MPLIKLIVRCTNIVSHICSGDVAFCPRDSVYPNPKEPSLLFPLGHHVDLYMPLLKRSRISASFQFSGETLKEKRTSIDVLPDECIFEVFRHLSGGQERSSCACVSKRWLSLLSSIRKDEFYPAEISRPEEPKEEVVSTKVDKPSETVKDVIVDSDTDEIESLIEDSEVRTDGHLSRHLEGKKATDIRLAAIAIGTSTRGGLGKLSIVGNNSVRGVTNFGLKAIARGCPSLRVLTLWNVSSISDEGLAEIASGCNMLEELDLRCCPSISDKALLAVANNCPNLTSLTIESCSNIGNDGFQSVGRLCQKLRSISIKKCPLVGDQGITSLVSSASFLTKLSLQALNVSDMSLAVIGHYGLAIRDLALVGLQNVTEKGFWVMGNGRGLQLLMSLTINCCQGVTDLGVVAIGKGCPSLKHLCLRKCAILSDNGLVSFAKLCMSLKSLELEECHRITQFGLFATLSNCGENIKAMSLANCFGIKDSNMGFAVGAMSPCKSLRSLSIRDCPGFGNVSLAILGRICPQLHRLNLTGLRGITDESFLPFIQGCEAGGLTHVNLIGCENLTDKAVSAIAKVHGTTLEVLNLDGCRHVTDAGLVAIAENCWFLHELDVSKCVVTDYGIAELARAPWTSLQILSMSNCPLVSDNCAPFLLKLGETLVGLDIRQCSAMSYGMVDLLVEKLWRCDILS